jgi:hypothetical protein
VNPDEAQWLASIGVQRSRTAARRRVMEAAKERGRRAWRAAYEASRRRPQSAWLAPQSPHRRRASEVLGVFDTEAKKTL